MTRDLKTSMTSFFCAQCSIRFNHQKEYLKHVQTKHLKSLIINTDIGCTVAFSRVGPGKFTCPTCYSACKDINDVLSHLLCEEISENDNLHQSDYFKALNADNILKSNTSNSAYLINDDFNDQNHFDFLLTSDSKMAEKCAYNPNLSQNLASNFNSDSIIDNEDHILNEKKNEGIIKIKLRRVYLILRYFY